ncbi:hypothetical protein BATDEDRAFT_90914 [Batrachochytrium dendrobatidis JAM81]|uniref:Nucleolar protein 12 n=1 Tax=Batrachochytrium dendrobatidis (strain JAM81 / FGSC 10211) TaxID=684364 RepID=F4P9K9_BATDJ|nr:uncharacterized protein BATDEDRAFT_90914 [Batrachochytrium dendrobatidis JAM81]EGF78338.1 hypothetical protein BATDEDRAFT_90914 [Batrachochytrium dendrobatidis JAM81]KAJ8330671.1 hypothetical protein O5D80_001184 [Batrachochytrium dendrobatidis]KAK5667787.1 hypothetical protein QVD99_005633 [Batrachochytrium dendrobatidis]|eukprot:XP_006681284.1 hypothetical protein BATDEDRAFT_90914 [Batrachochytrium dendrobatidis JAM81]
MKHQKKFKPARKPAKPKVESVQFDETARKDFLTGFHRRKVELHKKKVEKAKNRQKEEKREHRRERYSRLAAVMPKLEIIDSIGRGKAYSDTASDSKDAVESVSVIAAPKKVTTVTVTELDTHSLI